MKQRPLFLGVLLAVGTFDSSVLFVSSLLILWALWESRRELPPIPGLLLAGSIAATAPLSAISWHPLAISGVVLALFVLARVVRREWDSNSFFSGLVVGVIPQVIVAVLTWGDARPGLLSLNASQVAQTGLLFWFILPALDLKSQRLAWLVAGVQMAVSLSRAPMFAALVYVLQKPTWRRLSMFGGICGLFVVAMYSQGQTIRISPGALTDSMEIRTGLVDIGGSVMIVDGNGFEITTDPTKYTEPRFTLTGYGNGNYIAVTGLVRPHNVPLLMVYEMGILAIVPFVLFGWAVLTRRIPWAAALSMFLLWQVVEEPAARFEGMFVTAAVLIALWQRPLSVFGSMRNERAPIRPNTSGLRSARERR